MERMNEELFYKALGDVPEAPAVAFAGIERRVRSSGVKRRTTLAACLLLAFIIPALVLQHVNTSTVCAETYESMDELLYALEFMSGNGDAGFDYLLDADAETAAAPAAGGKYFTLVSDNKAASKPAEKESSDEK